MPSEQALPTTVEEAMALQQQLLAEVESIDAQLGSYTRYHDDGREYNDIEYERWRQDAKRRRADTLARYRDIKALVPKLAQTAAAETAGEQLRRLRYLAHNVVDAHTAVELSRALDAMRIELNKTASQQEKAS